MKRIKILMAGAAFFILSMSVPSLRPKAEAQVSVSLQIFYNNLSPYGDWTYYPRYGGYCWHPRVERSFSPYRTRGHWVWSDQYEWIWVSDYEWGWAPFHYGRWFYDQDYGWMWLPDYDWAPAWVVWRSSNSYYGWAPIGPGISFSLAFSNYSPPDYYWSFVPCRYVTSPAIYNYYVTPQQNTTIIHNTTIINNYNTQGGPSRNVFVGGPRRTDVQRFTAVTPVSLRESSKPGRTQARGNEVIAYKPNVTNRGNAEKPSRVVPIEKMTKVEGRGNEQRNQPVRNEPQRNQSQRNEPQRNQPQRMEPQRNQPQRNEPQKQQPQRIEPQRNQPQRNEPQRNQPQRMEPQRNQPQKQQPQRQEPQRMPPQRNQPQQSPPQRQQPQRQEPQRMPPQRNQPQQTQPQRNQPQQNPPQKQQPEQKQPQQEKKKGKG